MTEHFTKAVFDCDPASIVQSEHGLHIFYRFVNDSPDQHSKIKAIVEEIWRAYIKVYGFPVWVKEGKVENETLVV